MTSFADLERALGELGSDEWFRHVGGVRDNSIQPRLWIEPFDVRVVREIGHVWVWRGDLDVTAELSFDGPVSLEWLGAIGATEAELINIEILVRCTPYLTLSGIAIQEGCGADSPFDPSRDFWVLPIPDRNGGVDETASRILHDAVYQLAEADLLDTSELLDRLGLHASGSTSDE